MIEKGKCFVKKYNCDPEDQECLGPSVDGEYTDDECETACKKTYKCDGGTCVQDKDGKYTDDNCEKSDDPTAKGCNTYKCQGSKCIWDLDGTYTNPNCTTGDSLSNCDEPVISWKCDNDNNLCTQLDDGSGPYGSETECYENCNKWKCEKLTCKKSGTTGKYGSEDDCKEECNAPQSWDCSEDGICSDPKTGEGKYSTLALCQTACSAPEPKYSCSNGVCIEDPAGISLTECEATCPQTWICSGNDPSYPKVCTVGLDPGDGSAYPTQLDCEYACGTCCGGSECAVNDNDRGTCEASEGQCSWSESGMCFVCHSSVPTCMRTLNNLNNRTNFADCSQKNPDCGAFPKTCPAPYEDGPKADCGSADKCAQQYEKCSDEILCCPSGIEGLKLQCGENPDNRGDDKNYMCILKKI